MRVPAPSQLPLGIVLSLMLLALLLPAYPATAGGTCYSRTVSGSTAAGKATATFKGCVGKGTITSSSFSTSHTVNAPWHWTALQTLQNGTSAGHHTWSLRFNWIHTYRDLLGKLRSDSKSVTLGCTLFANGSWAC